MGIDALVLSALHRAKLGSISSTAYSFLKITKSGSLTQNLQI